MVLLKGHHICFHAEIRKILEVSSNQLLSDSIVLMRIPESYEVCGLMVTNETSYDSVVLTKDSRVIRGLQIDCAQ